MDNKNIDLIRDSAKELVNSNPLQAYKLFNLALKYRPDGVYLLEQEKILKKKLNIKKFIVIGNCQAKPLSELIEFKSSNFIVDRYIEVHLYEHENSINKELEKADYIITQNISDKYKGINTKHLKAKYADKLTVIPGLFFKGEHPDWFYPPRVEGKRPQSPIGDYHNKTVFDSFFKGLNVEQTLKNLNDYEYNIKHYKNEAVESIKELKERELICDTKISDVIEKAYNEGVFQFHSFNHPNKKLMNTHCNRILQHLELIFNQNSSPGECLNWDKLSNNPISIKNRNFSLFKNNIEITQEEFVNSSFSLYEEIVPYVK